MALLDLASHTASYFSCTDIIIALDRINLPESQHKQTIRDLGWVGFNLVSLDDWPGAQNRGSMAGARSERWIFLGMEV